MIITGDDVHSIQDLNCFLGQHFEMKDLGSLSFSLVLKSLHPPMVTISLKRSTHLISSPELVSQTVKVSTHPLNTTYGEPLTDATLYRQLVGCLVYLIVTQPRHLFAIHIVS
jgi:hypothetical protein